MKLRAHLGVFLACLGLVALWTWPLARDPAHLVPDNTDPRLFGWVMISVFRNLLTRPHLLLHGSGFYPMGSSLTFAEPLLTPALVAGPLFWLTGNPYLAYNVTLLLFWAVSGWAMYAVALWITRCHPAAAAAMLVFLLSPPRIEYAVEFQMEIMFGLPLCVYALVRYLEAQRLRHLVAFLVAFWLQALAVWYFAVILGCGLVVLALSYALRHWSGWRVPALLAAAVGGVVLIAGLVPVAWPFFVTRQELGLERSAGDALDRSANGLAYLTTEGTWLARIVPVNFVSETTLFPGLVALGLAVLATAWLRHPRGGRQAAGWPERVVAGAMGACVVAGVWSVVGGGRISVGSAWTRLPFAACGVALLGCLLLRDALAGWRRWRAGLGDRRLTEGEWVSTLGAVGLLALLLSFGPVVSIGRVAAGPGLYAWLHPYLLPLRAIRGTTRFGLLVLVVVALLTGLGVAWLAARRPGRPRRAALAVVVVALLLLDYVRAPLRYQWIPTYARPVDAALRADPDDVVVLEWPLNRPHVDVDAKLRTVGHGKRVVNGFAGFVPDFQRELSGLLSGTSPPLESSAARTAVARIYPLRYLVVRGEDLSPEVRPTWLALRASTPGFLRFRGSYGEDDLYEVVPLPERGFVLERVMAYDLLVSRPMLRVRLRPVRTKAGVEQWVAVTLNETPLIRARLDDPTMLLAAVTGPLWRSAPNLISITHSYRRSMAAVGAAHRIGTTGVTSPIDALVRSGGKSHGDVASIRVARQELAPNRRGYNLVAFDPSGAFRDRAVFDTLGDLTAAGRLAAWVHALPPGTVVLGAVKDEASGRLDAAAVAALTTLGVRGDLRGRYRESHAFAGVKGAPPGTAVETLGPRLVEVRVGEPDADFGIELTEFRLAPAAASSTGRSP